MFKCISSLIFVLLFLLNYARCESSLRCYDCKSAFNGHCDILNPKITQIEHCENSKLLKAFPQAGSKLVCVNHKMEQKDDPNLSVVRGCAPDNYCNYFKDSVQCVTCDKDLCNSSSAILPSFVLIVSYVFLKYFI